MQRSASAVKATASAVSRAVTRSKYTGGNSNLLGSTLEDLCRQATAKTLSAPDPDANRQVVEAIRQAQESSQGSRTSQQILSVLKGRLTQKNVHKQWLAISLVQQVLSEGGSLVQPIRGELLAEVAKIAAKPMNRYGGDLQAAQRAKNAAFNLLRGYGREGQEVLRGVTRDTHGVTQVDFPASHTAAEGREGVPGPPAPESAPRTWPETRDRVQTAIAVATSHTEMVQDMVLALSAEGEGGAGAGGGDNEMERGFLDDLVAEMVAFRTSFEALLGALAQWDNEEAAALMAQALEVADAMNNAVALHKEVTTAKKQGGASPAAGATAAASARPRPAAPARLAVPAAVPAAPATPAATPAGAPAAQASPLDGLLELQAALEEAAAPAPAPAVAPVDPFAASLSVVSPLGSPTPASNNPFSPGAASQHSLASQRSAGSGAYGGAPLSPAFSTPGAASGNPALQQAGLRGPLPFAGLAAPAAAAAAAGPQAAAYATPMSSASSASPYSTPAPASLPATGHNGHMNGSSSRYMSSAASTATNAGSAAAGQAAAGDAFDDFFADRLASPTGGSGQLPRKTVADAFDDLASGRA